MAKPAPASSTNANDPQDSIELCDKARNMYPTGANPEAGPDLKTSEPPQSQPHSTIPELERKLIIILVGIAAAISPFSTSTYYPAVTSIARDLKLSISLINLTISTYQIFQGLAPSVIAAVSDTHGRRPAYLLCFTVYFGANLGLALQDSYAALIVLRCLQSSGSSGTVALAQAVVADISTRAERGKVMAYATIGFVVGPALAPVSGGLLSQFLGWRAIFWFLLILGSIFEVIIFLLLRETNRSLVGDGSVPPQAWNYSILQTLRKDKEPTPNESSLSKKRTRINPLRTLKVLSQKENFIICIYGGLLFAGYASVTSTFATQLQERYHYNEVQVGLCYLPIAAGSLISRQTSAKLIDWNFKREAKKQGLEIIKNQQQDISNFNIEKTRLGPSFPMIFAGAAFMLGYGWLMEYRMPLASILVTAFFLANLLTGAMVGNAALLTDINQENAAAVAAAMNLTRCLMSASGIAVTTPLINAIGIGYTATITAGLWIVAMPALWMVYARGHSWRVPAV